MAPAASCRACRWAAAWACGTRISEAPAPWRCIAERGPGLREGWEPHAPDQRPPRRRYSELRQLGQAGEPRPMWETIRIVGPGQRETLSERPTLG